MRIRSLLLATALIGFAAIPAVAQNSQGQNSPAQSGLSPTILALTEDAISAPVLRATVTVASDVVRIGDVIDNAGVASQIAIYRAPDLGTTGTLPTSAVLNALRAHQVIGVNTKDIRQISVTRLARTLGSDDIELQVAVALEHRNGLGDATNLSLTFDTDVRTIQLDASNNGNITPASARFDSRSGRFDVTLEIANDKGDAPARLRFTGTAVETVEAAVLARDVDRNNVLRSSDVIVERRPKTEVGNDPASRDRAVGMQTRRQLRAGQALRSSDLAKPDLVQRDQNVTLIYESTGLYLTVRGKAIDGGTEGDVVSVLNLQSKRTVSGVVVGRGQVAVSVATPRIVASADQDAAPAAAPEALLAAPIANNDNAPVSQKAE